MNQRVMVRLLIPFALAIVSAFVYLPTLDFGFVLDDHEQIELSQAQLTWRHLPNYFSNDVWGYLQPDTVKGNYYRPIFMTWLMLNYELFGADPVLWHFSTVITHVIATLLVYFIARRLTGDAMIGGISALVFGVHPVHAEGVAWISAVTEPLFAIFFFGAVLAHLRGREEGQARPTLRWEASAWMLFTLAIFTKETAIVLPALIGAYEWLFPPSPQAATRNRLANAFEVALPYLGVGLIYVAIRYAVLGSLTPLARAWPLSTMLATWPFVLSFYLRQLVWPFEYSLFYPIAPVTHPGLKIFVGPVLIVGVVAIFLFWIGRRSRRAAFASLMLALPLLPVLNLRAFAFDDFLHDRYLYVPSAGFCIMLAIGLRRGISEHPRIQAAVLIPVAGLLAFQTVMASRPWGDNLELYMHTTQVAPESIIANEYLGGELLAQQRYADALPLLLKALNRFPTPGGLELYHLDEQVGQCHLGLGQLDQAASYIQDAIATDPRVPSGYVSLAMVELRQGSLAEAEAHIRQALQLRPRASLPYERFHYYLGAVLEAKGDPRGALAEYEAALQEAPDAEDVLGRVVVLRARLGQPAP